jgi:hypothetical protein
MKSQGSKPRSIVDKGGLFHKYSTLYTSTIAPRVVGRRGSAIGHGHSLGEGKSGLVVGEPRGSDADEFPSGRRPPCAAVLAGAGCKHDGELEPIETANWFPKLARKDYQIGVNNTGQASPVRITPSGYAPPGAHLALANQTASRLDAFVVGNDGAVDVI